MSNRRPDIIDLSKDSESPDENDSDNAWRRAREDYPETVNPDESAESDGEGNVYEEAREDYADEANADGERAKAFDYGEYGLPAYFDDKSFGELSEGDAVLIDTPIEGGKTGEVVGVEDAWTGTLNLAVDTGGNRYQITPYDDEFSEKFVAAIGDQGQLGQDMLGQLGKVSPVDVDVGSQVMLDVPNVGPCRGMVENKAHSRTQGARIDVNTGPVTFSVYEDPSPTTKKESPVLAGRVQ